MSNANWRHHRRRLRLPAAAVFSLSALVGCSNFNPRGDGFHDSFEQSAGVQRPTEPSTRPWGYSTKAQEIERDFGVR